MYYVGRRLVLFVLLFAGGMSTVLAAAATSSDAKTARHQKTGPPGSTLPTGTSRAPLLDGKPVKRSSSQESASAIPEKPSPLKKLNGGTRRVLTGLVDVVTLKGLRSKWSQSTHSIRASRATTWSPPATMGGDGKKQEKPALFSSWFRRKKPPPSEPQTQSTVKYSLQPMPKR